MASFAEKLANVVSRHDEISALLSSPDVVPTIWCA